MNSRGGLGLGPVRKQESSNVGSLYKLNECLNLTSLLDIVVYNAIVQHLPVLYGAHVTFRYWKAWIGTNYCCWLRGLFHKSDVTGY